MSLDCYSLPDSTNLDIFRYLERGCGDVPVCVEVAFRDFTAWQPAHFFLDMITTSKVSRFCNNSFDLRHVRTLKKRLEYLWHFAYRRGRIKIEPSAWTNRTLLEVHIANNSQPYRSGSQEEW